MTDRPPVARLCPCCCQRFVAISEPLCSDCALGHAANRRAPVEQRAKPRLDLSKGLPEDLSGYSVEDFLP
jgi:hypothetical protein